MKLQDKTVVITGAGSGIGAALARRVARENPRGVMLVDLDEARMSDVLSQVRRWGVPAASCAADVSDPGQVRTLIDTTEHAFGAPEVICSNAGIATGMGVHAGLSQWERAWSVNVLAHVHLAQAVLPTMAVRGSGYFLITASAAGLLSLPGDAPYTVSKHAAVALAEWLAVNYRASGIGVSVLCPLGVRTDLLMPGLAAGHPAAKEVAALAPILDPDEVAETTVRGLADERFLILPHPEVGAMYAAKAADPDAWICQYERRTR